MQVNFDLLILSAQQTTNMESKRKVGNQVIEIK